MSTRNKTDWRSAVDKKSGRTYYYNLLTKATQWNKPLELCTPEERQKILQFEASQSQFFVEMERNIRNRLRAGKTVTSLDPIIPTTSSSSSSSSQDAPGRLSNFSDDDDLVPMIRPTTKIRTISTMDDTVVEQMRKQIKAEESLHRIASHHISRRKSLKSRHHRSNSNSNSGDSLGMCLPASLLESHNKLGVDDVDGYRARSKARCGTMEIMDPSANASRTGNIKMNKTLTKVTFEGRQDSFGSENSAGTANDSSATDDDAAVTRERPDLTHRNSTGTIYLGSTMSAPDRDNSIRCVCAVARAHMIENGSGRLLNVSDDKDEPNMIFNDPIPSEQVPSENEVVQFFRDFYYRAKMESDCIIMTLIYLERIMVVSQGNISINYLNWKSLLVSCMILSSKVWDDMSMWNADFSKVCTSFTLRRINELEETMLNALGFSVKVLASEYAKYYFHIRTMINRLHISDSQLDKEPLDLAGAIWLQQKSEDFERNSKNSKRTHGSPLRRRCLTIHDGADPKYASRMHTDGYEYTEHHKVPLASVEQMMSDDIQKMVMITPRVIGKK